MVAMITRAIASVETISATSFCTLRAAIQEANACAGDNDILLNNGVTYVIGSALTVHPASESPTEVINLYTDDNEGAKAIIKGSGTENYLAFSSGMGTLNITNITISDSNGISVVSDATLNLNKVLMTDNHGNTGGIRRRKGWRRGDPQWERCRLSLQQPVHWQPFPGLRRGD